jgi:hypothetical protein
VSDTSHSQPYYDLAGAGYTGGEVTNGGAARINYISGQFTVDADFENHPVTYVSWYGATAFCNYYGYRLPTEWEWQAAADHTVEDPYTYGCGVTITNSMANYEGSVHPFGTTEVGVFGIYGYGMCDTAGNVWEWTSSIYSGSDLVYRSSGWNGNIGHCAVSDRHPGPPSYMDMNMGFRVCRDVPIQWAENGHYYLVVYGNWEEAEAQAVALGGHLVTVNDANEQQWLVNTFGPIDQDETPNRFWIGCTDKDSEGIWTWSSGDTGTYTFWGSGEPNGGTEEGEDYVYIGRYIGGGWNDAGVTYAPRGVAEFENLPTP